MSTNQIVDENTPTTARQDEVMAAILRYMYDHKRPPTVRDVAELLGIGNPNGAKNHIEALRKRGKLARVQPGQREKSRSLIPVVDYCPYCTRPGAKPLSHKRRKRKASAPTQELHGRLVAQELSGG